MNWLDFVLIAIVVIAAFLGMRTGLIGAAITAIVVLIGWLLAGRFSDDIGGLVGDSLSNDTWVTAISYAVIVVLAIIVARIVARIVRPLLAVATLGLTGMMDKLGGLVMGLIIGGAVAGALVIAMARFTYDFELPEEGIAGSVVSRIPNVEDTREKVEDALVASAIVPVFIDVADAIPGNALGFIPSDFKASLDILERSIDEEDSP